VHWLVFIIQFMKIRPVGAEFF